MSPPRTDGSETRAEQRMDVDSRGIASWWVSKAVNVLNLVQVGVGECQSMYYISKHMAAWVTVPFPSACASTSGVKQRSPNPRTRQELVHTNFYMRPLSTTSTPMASLSAASHTPIHSLPLAAARHTSSSSDQTHGSLGPLSFR